MDSGAVNAESDGCSIIEPGEMALICGEGACVCTGKEASTSRGGECSMSAVWFGGPMSARLECTDGIAVSGRCSVAISIDA